MGLSDCGHSPGFYWDGLPYYCAHLKIARGVLVTKACHSPIKIILIDRLVNGRQMNAWTPKNVACAFVHRTGYSASLGTLSHLARYLWVSDLLSCCHCDRSSQRDRGWRRSNRARSRCQLVGLYSSSVRTLSNQRGSRRESRPLHHLLCILFGGSLPVYAWKRVRVRDRGKLATPRTHRTRLR